MMNVFIAILALALLFDFLNGVHDSSNIVATMISSRAFRPSTALTVTAIANFVGPLVFGVAVANAIGEGIVSPQAISAEVIVAALLGAIIWNILTWVLGIPSSSSHALIGGILGAVAMGVGWDAINLWGLEKILLALFTSPLLGFITGFIVTRIIFFLVQGASPKINWFFKRSQIVTALALALSHGTNDAQKAMGVIAMGLVITGQVASFHVPFWVILASAAAIGLGTLLGGWRLIRTLGAKFYKIKPVDSFSSQLSSSIIIISASLLGGPVSTTQVVSSTIMGVGASDRVSKVRWGVAWEILVAWLVTIPASAALAAGAVWFLLQFDVMELISGISF